MRRRSRSKSDRADFGFRKVLEVCEKSKVSIDAGVMTAWSWSPASPANQFEADKKLYDLFVLICSGEALNLVEMKLDEGFEGWRQFALRFHPVGETYTFDKMNALMHQSRARKPPDLPEAALPTPVRSTTVTSAPCDAR